MLIERILYPVTSLGPGNRIGIWVCGCHRRCEYCANPELQEFNRSRDVPVDDLLEVLDKLRSSHSVDGITITGGEPFEQPDDLIVLVAKLKSWTRDILVFSGYTLEELREKGENVQKILDTIAVLIDGEYIDALNTGSVLRGSDNQRIHVLDEMVQTPYAHYLSGKREVQNFATSRGVISVGIHERGFREEIAERLAHKI